MKAATEIMNEHKTEVNISIHAAREGGDAVALAENPLVDISIHAAREGGDFLRQLGKSQAVKKFQSTPPVKAATVPDPDAVGTVAFQSTPPVKAATFFM